MKTPLKRHVIAATGDFGDRRTYAKIKHWVEEGGGKFATKITPDVTHLICSLEHYKRSSSMVHQARKIKGLSIVTFDWLEDSLLQKATMRARPFLLSRRIKAEQKAKAEKAATRKENTRKAVRAFEKGCIDARLDIHSDNYHLYRDATGFVYNVTLARVDPSTNKNERYNIKVFESHAVPRLFSRSLKYTGLGQMHNNIIVPVGSPFDITFATFKETFRFYTGKDWEQRFDTSKVKMQDENENEEDNVTQGGEGKTAHIKSQPYAYTPPRPGQPRGF